MATNVFLENIRAEEENVLYIFRVEGTQEEFCVKSFENGIATIDCVTTGAPEATTIDGLFDEQSNFAEQLCKFFKAPEGETLKALHLLSWDGKLEVKKPTSTLKNLCFSGGLTV